MNIIITAFEAFGGETINPSTELLKLIPSEILKSKIYKLYLPVSYNRASRKLIQAIKYDDFDYCIMLGQQGGANAINLESQATNLTDSNLPDNDGKIYKNTVIIEDSLSHLKSNVNLDNIQKHLQSEGINVLISDNAGTYVCNKLYYNCLHHIMEGKMHTKAFFVHLPYIHQQVESKSETYSTSLDYLNKAMQNCLSYLIRR